MINKENKDKKNTDNKKKDDGFVDTANMGVNCHLVIKDKDTGKILVNRRG